MSRSPLPPWLAAALIGSTGCGGCGDDLTASDAGVVVDARPISDAAIAADAAAVLSWVDFAVTGCGPAPGAGEVDAGAPCSGPAPLVLDFVALSPAPVELHAWSFGDLPDGDDDLSSATPRHVFDLPGLYPVSLDVQGPGGTAGVVRAMAIEVRRVGDHAPCTASAQCATERCVCDGGGCGPTLGLCSTDCDGGCGDGEVCADLAAGGSATLPWQDALCLADCATAGCPSGLACRVLPTATGLAPACFLAGVGGDLGQSCADPSGAPDDDRCVTGLCLAEGVRGMCSAPCSAGQCSDGAACATFTGSGDAVCLPRCDATAACDEDPWLGCELAGGPGSKGFLVDEVPSTAGYCAPRRCTGPADCVGGSCTGGFCGP